MAKVRQAIVVKGEMQNQPVDVEILNTRKTIYRTVTRHTQI